MDADSSHMPIKREKSSAEIRKSNKPLMEKRRRERINTCLEQLKSILMEVTKKESSYYSKLEKADILEMTVKYLKNAKRQQMSTLPNDPAILTKYIAGYNECTNEVNKYLSGMEGLAPEARTRLIGHLANSLQRSSGNISNNASSAVATTNVPGATPLTALPGTNVCMLGSATTSAPLQTISTAAPMQILPAKLPGGEVVLLLANPQNVTAPLTQNSVPAMSATEGKPCQLPQSLISPPSASSPTPSSSSSSSASSSPASLNPLPSPNSLKEENNNYLSPPSSPPALDLSHANSVFVDTPQNVALNLSQPKSRMQCCPSPTRRPSVRTSLAPLQSTSNINRSISLREMSTSAQSLQDNLNNNLNEMQGNMWRPW